MSHTNATPQDQAQTIGYEAGKARGSWAFDGNSDPETAARVLQGYEDGDPEVLDMEPSPLSGEWAGESISELSVEYDIDLEDGEVADAFELGYSDGFWAEVTRAARAMTA